MDGVEQMAFASQIAKENEHPALRHIAVSVMWESINLPPNSLTGKITHSPISENSASP